MDLLAAGNLLVLCPVIAVVAGVVLVFLFGFKQPSQPKKFTATSDSSKKTTKKKETKKPVAEKAVSASEPARKERSAEVAPKKSPTKEASQKKAPVRQESVKTPTKAKTTVKSTKKEKVKAEVVPAQKKPDDFDDGSWFTVPTKSEKKRPKLEDVTSSPKPESSARSEQSTVEKKNAKNAKQLKDQANKSKKEAEDAAIIATKVLQVEKIISEPVVTETAPKTRSTVLNEEDKQTAEIIEKIHEAIADVVIEPVVVQKQIVSNSISKKIVADREEKVDEIKPVESNVAFDELADAWTDAKPTKKNKKKVRKD